MSNTGKSAAFVHIMTKAPIPGTVKTRLGPAIGMDAAAQLHGVFVALTIAQVRRAGLPFSVSLGGDPDGVFRAHLESMDVAVEAQPGGSLGQRLVHVLRRPGRQIAIGTDCPLMPTTGLQAAADTDAVLALGPVDDGGYWVVSVDGDAPEALFTAAFSEIPWSTDRVLSTTQARCEGVGVSPALLPRAWDVDESSDLDRLLAHPDCPAAVRALFPRR